MDILSDANPVEQKLVERANEAQIPISSAFELTPVCNLHCDMCYVRMEKSQVDCHGGLKDLQFWLDKAEQLKKEGCLFLLLTGGEPLMYPWFMELYLALHEMGIIVSLNTNATLLTPEIADILAEHKPRRVNVTLYGASNETYENLCHIKNGYDKCMQGIKMLQERGIQMRLNLTQVVKNQKDYFEMLHFAEREGLHAMAANYISVFSNPLRGSEEIFTARNTPEQAAMNELNFKQYQKGMEEFGQYVYDLQEYLKGPMHPVLEGTKLTCRAGKSSCWVTWQGNLVACVDLNEPAVSLTEYSAHDAWEMLKSAVKELPTHTECKDCKLKPLCDVCYANATNEKKHCGSLDYLCQMAEAKVRIISSIPIQIMEKPL